MELPRIELGSSLLSRAYPTRLIPTCVGKIIRGQGAFGEPARLVDDVHMLAGRIHRPTV